MRIVIHPCLHLHDELEVSVTNFRGGDAINLNLLFFQHMIQENQMKSKKFPVSCNFINIVENMNMEMAEVFMSTKRW